MTKKEDGSLPLWKSGDRGANFRPIVVFDGSQKGHVLGRCRSTSLLSHAHVHENPPQPRFEACVAAKAADRPDSAYEGFVDCIATALDLTKVGDREAKVARVMLAVDRLDVADRARLSSFVLRLRHH